MNAPSLYMHQLKKTMREVWMAGDFGMIAKNTMRGAEEFIARLNIPPGARVLDVACGTGNTSLPLARGGAQVTGVDIATNLLEQARARAAAEALDITFEEGDAEQLPYPDASFDAVVTMFGAMFAPRHELVAAEFARVLKPGGLLAMANWTPGGFAGQMFQVTARHTGAAMGIAPPVHWGHAMIVRARLAAAFEHVQLETILLEFDIPASPAGAVAFFRRYFGPTQAAFDRLDEAGQGALAAELEVLWAGANVAPDPTKRTVIRNEYLQVVARRK
jgi:2-polyprenyl-3-methyl-5-hydroxy-6-metoxy-1,4-benzoquinol methylase